MEFDGERFIGVFADDPGPFEANVAVQGRGLEVAPPGDAATVALEAASPR